MDSSSTKSMPVFHVLQDVDATADLDYETKVCRISELLELSSIDGASNNEKIIKLARAQWVIRWLVTKLSSKDSIGIRARSCNQTWSLLTKLISSLSSTLLTKSLNEHGSFLEHVLRTLEDVQEQSRIYFLPVISSTVEDHIHVDKLSHSQQISSSDKKRKSHDISQSQSPTKKQKQNSDFDQKIFSSQDSSQSYDLVSKLLESLDSFLEGLFSIANKKDREFHREHVLFILRGNYEQTARILGIRLNLYYMISMYQSENSHCQMPTNLSPYLRIWQHGELFSDKNKDTAEQTFCNHCLMPILKMVSLLNHRLNEMNDSILKHQKIQLERLICKYVFASTRKYQEDRSNMFQQKKRRDYSPSDQLYHLLGINFESQDSDTVGETSISENEAEFQKNPKFVTSLFDVASRYYDSTFPSRKNPENISWLDSIFVAHATCSGFHLDEQKYYKHESKDTKQMEEMLKILIEHRQSIEKKTLRRIAESYCRLETQKIHDINWNLIAVLLRLDPDIFTPQLDEMTGSTSTGSTSNSLAINLFEALTVFEPQRMNENSSKEIPQENKASYHMIKSEVSIPLLRNICSNRIIYQFLKSWKTYLMKGLLNIHDLHKSHCLWNDSKMLSFISDNFEQCSSVFQILASIRQDIKILEELKFSESPNQIVELQATMTLLCAKFESLSREDYLQEFSTNFLSTSQHCLERLDKTSSPSATEVQCLNLFVISFKLWGKTATSAELKNVVHSISNVLLSRLNNLLDRMPSKDVELYFTLLKSIGEIGACLQLRHITSNDFPRLSYESRIKLKSMFQRVSSPDAKSISQVTTWLLTKYSNLLLSTPIGESQQILSNGKDFGNVLLDKLIHQDFNTHDHDDYLWIEEKAKSFLTKDKTKASTSNISIATSNNPKDQYSKSLQLQSKSSTEPSSVDAVIHYFQDHPDHTSELFQLAIAKFKSSEVSKSAGDLKVLWIIIFSTREKGTLKQLLQPTELSKVLQVICDSLRESNCSQTLVKSLQIITCITSIREIQLLQSSVDMILSTLNTIISDHTYKITFKLSRFVHIRLCEIISHLISNHRKRITHRLHVVLQLIQTLFRCFFHPLLNTHRLTIPHPYWLSANSTSRYSAEYLTKALNRLADPIITTTSNHHDRQNLTDSIQTARNHVGRFSSQFLTEMIRCHTYGKVDMKIRSILMPGVCSMFDIAQKEQIDRLLMDLNEESSEVFQNLWSEWKKERGTTKSL